jgi:hypothetical protein
LSILFWPFIALWRLLTFILVATGRIIGALLGLILTIVGILLTVVVVAAPVGIPLLILGVLLMIRSLF